MEFIGTWWSLVPPIIAIILALFTKEVYLSLFVGIICAGLLYTDFNIIQGTNEIFTMMIEKLASDWNIGILIFLVFLGILVALMNKAGGSKAYGRWASSKIKDKKGAMLSTFALGVLIFVDDYFNCLTVGSVMRTVTDKYKISRAKLAYIIDSTAAPICIIAPISSWAAAVSGYTQGDGFTLFLQTIPFNLYALLTMIMVIYVANKQFDFQEMQYQEELASQGQIMDEGYKSDDTLDSQINDNGKVYDLILPVAFLIIACITAMVYTGGYFNGVDFITAFSECNASFGLVLGSFYTLVFIFILYVPRRVLTFKEFADCIPQGFKSMVPAMTILTLAWTLGGFVSERLLAGAFVKAALDASSFTSVALLPCILFVIAVFLAFATGTSWGTFSILIPIVTNVFTEGDPLLVISISAVLAGAVCGDHISPISDTTIMASAGAQCNHVVHVSSQLPYAITVALASFIGFIIAGFTQNLLLTLATGLISLFVIILFIKKRTN